MNYDVSYDNYNLTKNNSIIYYTVQVYSITFKYIDLKKK